jgi:hypothetical protein
MLAADGSFAAQPKELSLSGLKKLEQRSHPYVEHFTLIDHLFFLQ